MPKKKDMNHMERLRKAIMSAASLIQEVPEGTVPDEDTLDFIDSDLRAALSALEDIQEDPV
jgi:hypothetical protein